MSAQRNSPDDRPDHDLHRLDHLQLPAHVSVWVHGAWRPGWLIACDNQTSGWHGLVQYQDEHHAEITAWMAAEQIIPGGDR
ncbi:hypothetical protein EV643_108274 [Kribbella sp. VKM Ac-2527]|uniref:Uncharacterized protein n=1 Tax=Kribbella caucasensis TaxID=2512215 RepID=A0A4V3CA55_9ACTN|nr:hypothetical protein [Kribbella sp. VKM Ac-2527]TDO47957.1 hypothetical protein EV643_108274 [Kribbella sp. VKM Ac-2527]